MKRMILKLLCASLLCASSFSFGGGLDADLLANWQWRLVGPSTPAGRAWTVVGVDSAPKTLYVTTASGGVWKSVNAGTTFEPIFDDANVASTSVVAVAPQNPDIVWVATGEPANTRANSWGDGVYKSENGGESWTHAGLSETHMIGHLIIHPKNPDIVYVAAMGRLWGRNDERGIFRTSNGGRSWDKILFVDDTTGFNDIQMHPENPDVLYAAAWQRFRYGGGDMVESGPSSGLYKSTDGGDTWTLLENGLPADPMGKIHIAIARGNPELVYANILTGEPVRPGRTSSQGGLFRSQDAGASWVRVNDRQTSYYYDRVYVDPNNDESVWMPVFELNVSRDGGRTFEEVNMRHVHNDLHSMWIDPNDSDHIVVSGDGGVSITYDGAETWQQTVLPIGQFYETAVDDANPYHIFGGMQDTGHWRAPVRTYDEEGITAHDWIKLRYTGDGMGIAADPRDENIIYMSQQFGNTSRLDLRTWDRIELQPRDTDALRARGATHEQRWDWSPAFMLSRHDPDYVYIGGNYLFRIHGASAQWELISPDLTRQQDTEPRGAKDGYHSYGALFSVAESPLAAETLWAGADDGPLWVTTNGGREWTRVDTNIEGPGLGSPPQPPSGSASIADLPGMLPLGSWPTPCVVAEIEPSHFDEHTAYVAYDCHKLDDEAPYLFKTTDGGASWTSVTGDLPIGSTWVVKEDPAHAKVLYAGTEFGIYVTIDGGGHWERLLGNLPRVGTRSLAIQARDKDLVAATYGRSIWVTDIAPFAEMADGALDEPLHLFAVKPATLFKTRVTYGNTIEEMNGDMFFRAANPPDGALIRYHLRDAASDVRIEIRDASGALVRALAGGGARGLHMVEWDLKTDETAGRERERRAPVTPSEWEFSQKVAPGRYRIRIIADELTARSFVTVAMGSRHNSLTRK